MWFWRSGAWLVVLAAVVIIGGLIAGFAPGRVGVLSPPPPTDGGAIEILLDDQDSAMAPFTGEILSWVLRLPESSVVDGELLVGLQPSASLPRSDLMAVPKNTLSEDGRYLSVSDDQNNFIYIARLGDPRIVRGEGIVGGEIDAAYEEANEGGVSSGKAPFVPDGILRVFEVENGHVSRVYLLVPLPHEPFPARGKRFRVPFS